MLYLLIEIRPGEEKLFTQHQNVDKFINDIDEEYETLIRVNKDRFEVYNPETEDWILVDFDQVL